MGRQRRNPVALSCGKGWGIHSIGLPAYRAGLEWGMVKHMGSGTTHVLIFIR